MTVAWEQGEWFYSNTLIKTLNDKAKSLKHGQTMLTYTSKITYVRNWGLKEGVDERVYFGNYQ